MIRIRKMSSQMSYFNLLIIKMVHLYNKSIYNCLSWMISWETSQIPRKKVSLKNLVINRHSLLWHKSTLTFQIMPAKVLQVWYSQLYNLRTIRNSWHLFKEIKVIIRVLHKGEQKQKNKIKIMETIIIIIRLFKNVIA